MPSLRSQFLPHKSRIPIISGHTRHECVMNNERWSVPNAECRCNVTSALIIESPLLQMPSLFNPLCILVYDTYNHCGCSMLITKKVNVSCAKCAHAHSNHVRDFAFKCVACEYHSFQLAHNHSIKFWGDCCCCHLRVLHHTHRTSGCWLFQKAASVFTDRVRKICFDTITQKIQRVLNSLLCQICSAQCALRQYLSQSSFEKSVMRNLPCNVCRNQSAETSALEHLFWEIGSDKFALEAYHFVSGQLASRKLLFCGWWKGW